MTIKVGIIGGTGLDNPDILSDRQEWYVETPFGKPSDALVQGKIKGINCVLLGRHGRRHNINPTNINYRANIWALREAGCTHILATTACGSLQENIQPGDMVFLDQFIDRTTKRQTTFYDGSPHSPQGVCHIPCDKPFCDHTRDVLIEAATELNYRHHTKGTTVTIEGPRFSTKAESRLFQLWGANVVNMTTVPEAVLAREAGLSYAAVALVTDYDCWRECGDSVTVDGVLKVLKENSERAIELLLLAVFKLSQRDWKQVIEINRLLVKNNTMLPK